MIKTTLTPQAEEEVQRLLANYPPELVHAIQKALAERLPKRRGRPPEDDSQRLSQMADLLFSEEATSLREAARKVAAEDPGHSEDATARRLRRNYSENRQQLEADAEFRARLRDADPDDAGHLLMDHVESAVGDLRDASDREDAARKLKFRLMALVDEVKDSLDARSVQETLDGVVRPFRQGDIDPAFDEDVATWEL